MVQYKILQKSSDAAYILPVKHIASLVLMWTNWSYVAICFVAVLLN